MRILTAHAVALPILLKGIANSPAGPPLLALSKAFLALSSALARVLKALFHRVVAPTLEAFYFLLASTLGVQGALTSTTLTRLWGGHALANTDAG